MTGQGRRAARDREAVEDGEAVAAVDEEVALAPGPVGSVFARNVARE